MDQGSATGCETTGGAVRCQHQPNCPPADAPDRDAARVVASHPEQGWNLLCNGVVSFDDAGDLLPDGRAIPPQGASGRSAA
jgi:hypothetical protein